MQNTSSTYKELIKQSGRMFKAKITCNFADGSVTELNDSNIMQNSLKISDATSNEGNFAIGCAIINELDFEIDNSDGNYNNMSFDNAKFNVQIGLVTEQKYDGTLKIEWLRKGLYIAEEVTVNEKYISIIAYDYMAKLDKDFSGVNVSFPTTLANLLSSVCAYCSVAYGSLDFPNSNLIVKSGEYFDESTSCRDVVSYIAQLACSYAYIDMSGYLRLGWYSDTDISIDERQRLNGTVTVTGVQLTDASDESKVYQIGTTNYCLIMDKNPLVQGSIAVQNNVWTDRLVGMTLTPFEATVLSDPSLEAGDIVTIYDLHGNSYRTPITSIIYQLDGKMTISCDAETVNEKKRSSCSQSAKVIAAAKKETQKQLSEYAVRAQLFNELTANSMGFYQTVETQDDGSQIIYQHDKPLLSDSTVIWKKSVDTFSVSTDGGKTWTGFDKDGNAVLKILAVEGIIADWIKAGILSDKSGKMSISLDSGIITFDIDNSGKMQLHTKGFTLYDKDDKVLTSMYVSVAGRGIITANKIFVGERNNETTYISEDDNGQGYVSTNRVIADNISAKNSIIGVKNLLQSESGYRVINSNGNEVGVLYVSSAGNGICKVDYIIADNLAVTGGGHIDGSILVKGDLTTNSSFNAKTINANEISTSNLQVTTNEGNANISSANIGIADISSLSVDTFKLSNHNLGFVKIKDASGQDAYVLGYY